MIIGLSNTRAWEGMTDGLPAMAFDHPAQQIAFQHRRASTIDVFVLLSIIYDAALRGGVGLGITWGNNRRRAMVVRRYHSAGRGGSGILANVSALSPSPRSATPCDMKCDMVFPLGRNDQQNPLPHEAAMS